MQNSTGQQTCLNQQKYIPSVVEVSPQWVCKVGSWDVGWSCFIFNSVWCVSGWYYIFVFWYIICLCIHIYIYILCLYVYVNRYSTNICAHVLMHPVTCFFERIFTICNMYFYYIYMYIADNMRGAFPLYYMMECLVQTYSTRWIQMMPSRLWVHWVIYCKTSKYWCTKTNWARPKSHVLENNRIQYGLCATFPIWQFWGGCKYVMKMWRFHSPTAGLLSQETNPQLPPK